MDASKLRIGVDVSGLERIGVGAKIYDAFALFEGRNDTLNAPRIAMPRGDKIIINKSEFIKWVKIVNGDVWSMKDFEVALDE
ncbi:MAG TPA: hypothetical protein DDW34_13015 [Clostridium sp.]|nr:hypothetical protein [Clostridium sp.]